MDPKEVAAKFKHLEEGREHRLRELRDGEETRKRQVCWWLLAATMILVAWRVVLTIMYWGR